MSATAVASAQLSRAGVAQVSPTTCDTTNGNITTNTGATVFRFQNTDSASHTVTVTSLPTEDGLALADLVLTIPASATWFYSDFDTAVFGSQMTYLASSTMVEVTVYEP